MKFLVDAHLSPAIAELLRYRGYAAVHTSQLKDRNETSDADITKISLEEKRIVITKDSDFYYSFILHNKPYKVLFVRTGNMSTNDLGILLRTHLDTIIKLFETNSLLELHTEKVYILM